MSPAGAQGALEKGVALPSISCRKGWPVRRDAVGPVGIAISIKDHTLLMKNIPGKSRLKASVCLARLK